MPVDNGERYWGHYPLQEGHAQPSSLDCNGELGAAQRAPSKVGTSLSLVANEACEAIRAEAVEGDIVLAQQAGPTIQAQAGVTEVTCSGRNKSFTQ